MATPYDLNTDNIKIYRQGNSNGFWAKWSLTSEQKNLKITEMVYKKVGKKYQKVETSVNYSDQITSYDVRFKYKVSKITETWYLDKEIKGIKDPVLGTRSNLWTPPDDAVAIGVQVKPNTTKTYKVSSKKSAKWFTAEWSAMKIMIDHDKYPTSPPSISTFTIRDKDVHVVATIDISNFDLDENGAIRYQILKDNKTFVMFGDKNYKTFKFDTFPESGVFTFDTTLTEIGSYQVRAAVANYVGSVPEEYEVGDITYPVYEEDGNHYYIFYKKTENDVTTTYAVYKEGSSYYYLVNGAKVYVSESETTTVAIASGSTGYKWSDYSAWSSSVDTRPQPPELKSVKAIGADQVKIEWSAVPNITEYKIEYVNDNTRNFDSNMIQSVSVNNVTSYILSGLEVGHVIWFRMRSVNTSDESEPSNIIDITLAVKPSAPTTWSSTTKASITSDISTTDELFLYWIHNSTDGSAQEYAKLQFKILDNTYYLTVENTERDEFGETVDRMSTLSLWDLVVYSDEANNTEVGTIYSIFKFAGAESIKWKVSTKGAHASYSDWSIERTIEAYAKPNLELSVTDVNGDPLVGGIFTSFPLHITGVVTPTSQTPISFYMSIIAGSSYSTTDLYGEAMDITEGSEIFSKYLDTDVLDYTLTPKDVDFVSDASYILKVFVYTDAGLNAEATYEFSPRWTEISEFPNAMIDINETYRYADIRPYCNYFIGYDTSNDATIPEDHVPNLYFGSDISGVNNTPTSYQSSGIETAVIGDMYFNSITYEVYACIVGGNASTAKWLYKTRFSYPNARTWYSGEVIDGTGEDGIYPNSGISSSLINDFYFNTKTGDIYKCITAGSANEAVWSYVWNCFWQTTPDISLSVYRRRSDGSYVTINEGIDNTYQNSDEAITIRDPHPSFGTCVYRIVATNIQTGAIGYIDIAREVDETSVVVQWDEVWNDVTENPDGEVFEGSILKFPANIKISDQNTNDADLVSYIGRERPVAYYGTQRGESLSINCDFDKEDTDTLAILRRLMAYRGNVYVREPSGLGYWANITVSYNRDYSSLIIPVTLTIKPVEGGI